MHEYKERHSFAVFILCGIKSHFLDFQIYFKRIYFYFLFCLETLNETFWFFIFIFYG